MVTVGAHAPHTARGAEHWADSSSASQAALSATDSKTLEAMLQFFLRHTAYAGRGWGTADKGDAMVSHTVLKPTVTRVLGREYCSSGIAIVVKGLLRVCANNSESQQSSAQQGMDVMQETEPSANTLPDEDAQLHSQAVQALEKLHKLRPDHLEGLIVGEPPLLPLIKFSHFI